MQISVSAPGNGEYHLHIPYITEEGCNTSKTTNTNGTPSAPQKSALSYQLDWKCFFGIIISIHVKTSIFQTKQLANTINTK
jgi:hypothetical protein